MAARMQKTSTPGIYKRGERYVATWWANGKQHKKSAKTLKEARAIRAARQAEVASGEYEEQSKLSFREYAREWVDRYQGRGGGFRESTRRDYRRMLERYVLPYFDERLGRRVSQIRPRDVANFVGWLCDEQAQAVHERQVIEKEAKEAIARGERPRRRRAPTSKRLSDSTVRNILNPLRACLGTAVAEGLIRSNPTQRVSMPYRPNVEDLDRDPVRAFTREQLRLLLELVPARHRVMFRMLAVTGLRISELVALQWRHLVLDGSAPHVRVRRACVDGEVHPPKSKYGRRDVPLPHDVVVDLRTHRRTSEWPGDEDLVFPSLAGTFLLQGNVRRRVLAPAAEEAGVPWAGFHAFRHTCASMLFERGANAVQVQRWLGHHSPAFTLARYVHLLSDSVGEPLELDVELGDRYGVATPVATSPAERGRTREAELATEAAL